MRRAGLDSGSALSPECADRLEALFSDELDRELARLALVEECGPHCDWFPRERVDRIRFAVLKLSGGSLTKLERAIELARTDFRDLLMAAGFGASVDADRYWDPRDRT